MDSAYTTLSSEHHTPHQTCNTAHIYSAKLVPKYEHIFLNQAQSCSYCTSLYAPWTQQGGAEHF